MTDRLLCLHCDEPLPERRRKYCSDLCSDKQYRKDNKEHIKKHAKQWYKDNKEHIKQYNAQPHVKERRKQYRAQPHNRICINIFCDNKLTGLQTDYCTPLCKYSKGKCINPECDNTLAKKEIWFCSRKCMLATPNGLICNKNKCNKPLTGLQRKYCSTPCQTKYHYTTKRQHHFCLLCNTPLIKSQSKYCSPSCRIEQRSMQLKKETKLRRSQQPPKYCLQCNNLLTGKQKKYCSPSCSCKHYNILRKQKTTLKEN